MIRFNVNIISLIILFTNVNADVVKLLSMVMKGFKEYYSFIFWCTNKRYFESNEINKSLKISIVQIF